MISSFLKIKIPPGSQFTSSYKLVCEFLNLTKGIGKELLAIVPAFGKKSQYRKRFLAILDNLEKELLFKFKYGARQELCGNF